MFPLSGSIVLIVTNRHYVALKILTAETTANGNEVRLLKWLNDQSRNHPGYHHIAHLLGSFQIKGPNGTHDVLVMEAMVSLSWLRREASDIISSHGKSFIYQMISGLSYLHSLEVMHGGMIVLPLHLEDQTDSLPAYVVPPISLAELVLKQLRTSKSNDLCVKIMDFGNGQNYSSQVSCLFALTCSRWKSTAFRQGDPKPPPHSPPYLRAPEIEIWQRSGGKLASDWGIKGDIWSLGCTVCALFFFSFLSFSFPPRTHVHQHHPPSLLPPPSLC